MATTKKSTHAANGDRWSQHVTETSDAMDLEPDLFKSHDPKAIARSLKASAEHSDRRKAAPFRSAMSMLTFYVNRAGDQLDETQRGVLDQAKDELRKLFGRDVGGRVPAKKPASTSVASGKAAAGKPRQRTRRRTA